MARNIEIKAKVRDEAHIRQYMAANGSSHEVQEQRDVFLRANYGRLKLRCFPDGSGVLVAYDRPDHAGPKTSTYTLAPVEKSASLEIALTQSLGTRGLVIKKRAISIVGQTRIHLDEVHGLGTFMELEVVLRPEQSEDEGRTIAEHLMRDLRIADSDLLDRAYMDMLEEKQP